MPISLATSESVYVWSNFSNTISNESNTNSIKESTNSVSTTPIDLNLESASAILIEQNTGKILYEHNAHEQLRPASVTKVMSILLIMEALDTGKIALTDKVPCSQTAASMGGSQIWLDVREELTVDEMLKAICVASANDCVVAMAEYLEGSQEAFVAKMNAKATQLGMLDTCFKNCHGLDEDGHVTSAYDISLMSQELLKKHPSITNYTTIWIDSLRDGKSELTNTNKLIRNYKGATGLKTGSTGLALYNLSASATRDSLSLIAVIMKAPSTKVRFAEAEKLLDYGFNNYSYQSFAKSGDVLKTIHINKGVKSSVEAVYETDAGSLLQKGQGKEIEQVVTIADTIEAPITKGQKIGEITYTLNGEVIETTNLISNAEIKKISLTNMMENLFFTWFRILR
ncbi:MAG: D-alanyl-D-alanine carboxypeptidase family protein [Clostridia bacterium]